MRWPFFSEGVLARFALLVTRPTIDLYCYDGSWSVHIAVEGWLQVEYNNWLLSAGCSTSSQENLQRQLENTQEAMGQRMDFSQAHTRYGVTGVMARNCLAVGGWG